MKFLPVILVFALLRCAIATVHFSEEENFIHKNVIYDINNKDVISSHPDRVFYSPDSFLDKVLDLRDFCDGRRIVRIKLMMNSISEIWCAEEASPSGNEQDNKKEKSASGSE